jgi:hypothetical protein
MDKAPKSHLELRRLVLAALRKVPGCQGVEDVTIEPLMRSGDHSGWVVTSCAPGSAAVVDCKRALAPIQDLFRQMDQLVPAMAVRTPEDQAACIDDDRRPLDRLIMAAPALRALAETTLDGAAENKEKPTASSSATARRTKRQPPCALEATRARARPG